MSAQTGINSENTAGLPTPLPLGPLLHRSSDAAGVRSPGSAALVVPPSPGAPLQPQRPETGMNSKMTEKGSQRKSDCCTPEDSWLFSLFL